MDSVPEHNRHVPDRAEVSALLRESRALMQRRQFRRAAINYRILLRDPALPADSAAQSEAVGNLGIALLCRIVGSESGAVTSGALGEVIKLLNRARALRRDAEIQPSPVLEANLALAHHQLFLHSGDIAHLMAAHMVLEAIAPPADAALRDRVESIRRLLLEAAKRQRQ